MTRYFGVFANRLLARHRRSNPRAPQLHAAPMPGGMYLGAVLRF